MNTTLLDKAITTDESLLRLKEGNFRFITNMPINRDHLTAVNDTKDGQAPYAAIVSCMDSRTSAELIFDQGVGDIFSIRIAGNVVTDDVLGSLEYATAVAGAKLIMVLGHTHCGAIKGACDHVKMGHLTSLLERIAPALEKADRHFDDRNSHNHGYVTAVTEYNIQHSMQQILQRSAIINDLVQKKQVAIVSATYDVGTGRVSFGDI